MNLMTYKNNTVGILIAILGFAVFLLSGISVFVIRPSLIDPYLGVVLNLIGIVVCFVGLWLRPFAKIK